jgi:flagellar basal body-associated protein FliL
VFGRKRNVHPPASFCARGTIEKGESTVTKKLAIIAGLALLFGVGGGGVYASGLFGGPTPAEASAQETKPEAPARTLPEVAYIQLDPLAAPVIGGGKIRYNVMLTLSVEVAEQSHKADVTRLMPRLRDAMLMELYARPVTRNDESGRIDLESVKERMFTVARDVVGEKIVRDLLVVSAIRTS